MRKLKNYFTLEEVKDLPPFLQSQVTRRHTDQDNRIGEIKDMLLKGYKQTEIAKELNISKQAVNEFIKKHIRSK